MRIFVLSYTIGALVLSLTTTVMQVQPALFFIKLIVGQDRTFSLTLAFGLTFLALAVPVVVLLLISRTLNKNRNVMPDISGKTGIVVHRKKSLYGALYDSAVMVDGELKSSVSNGRSTFVELTHGKHVVAIKGSKTGSAEVDVPRGKVVDLLLSYVDSGGLTAKVVLEQVDDRE